MEATRSSFVTKLAIGLSAVLLAAVMIVCIPQGQALADDTAADVAAATALQEFTATKAVGEQPAASAADVARAPKQASGTKSTRGLLCKVDKKYVLYPCDKNGNMLDTHWKVGSTIKTIFVSPTVRTYKTWKISYWSPEKLDNPVNYKIQKIIFLTKNGESSVTIIGAKAIDTTVKTVKNFQKTKVKKICELAFAGTKITKISFPKTLKTISKSAFYKTLKLKTVIGLEKSRVTSIGSYAFSESGITQIALPKRLKTIGEGAFYKAKSLKKVTGLENTRVTSIRAYVFAESGVTSVTVPTNLQRIGKGSFYNAKALKSVKGLGKTKLLSINKFAFRESGITTISLPKSVSAIAEDAFRKMPYLVDIGGLQDTKVKSIEPYTFAQSPKLANVRLPSTCTKIGEGAFWKCTGLNTLALNADTVVAGGPSMLVQSKIATASSGVAIKVPTLLVRKYELAQYWSSYSDKLVAR